EIAEIFLGIDSAALLRLTDDGAVLDFIVIDGAGPAGEVHAVEDTLEPGRAMLAQDFVRFGGRDVADEDIAPSDFVAVRLQLDLALRRQRQLLVPEVFQAGEIDDQLVIEIDRDALADHQDAERIPFAEGLVGQDERVLAGGAGAVVPQAAAALVSAELPLA